ncbi:MAG: GNAT family N-acetyltransferase [Actinomycetota bacterium]|nr:GNAT family N-acetyltransferase [Actinomycetota bacterium]
MQVRAATSADAWAIATVHVDSWRSTYAGLIPDDLLARLSVERRAEGWGQLLARDEPASGVLVLESDGVVGFCHYSRSRDDDTDDATAELTAIYLLERAWGKGGGTMLVGEATGAMARAGYNRVTLWVLEGNLRAPRFYEARGWGRDGAFKVENRESFELRELRYVRALARI